MALPQTTSLGLRENDLLELAEAAPPRMVLTFYDHCLLVRKYSRGGETEYPIAPAALAQALALEAQFSTGLLSSNTLSVIQHGARSRIIEYRPAQLTGFWIEGSELPVRVPLPPLVLIRDMREREITGYRLYAVKARPDSPATMLYNAPLPNVSGGVCWGTVPKPNPEETAGVSLEADWKLFFGSPFGTHSLTRKSQRYHTDIRRLYMQIEHEPTYPLDDLVFADQTIELWLTL